MNNKQLPADVQKRIKADAEKLFPCTINTPVHKKAVEHLQAGYIVGATAVTERAQVLVDALEKITTTGWQNWQAHTIAKEALQQWKEGKEVENG